MNSRISSEKNKILIVEDNQINRKLACFILRKKGFDCIQASNGKEALEILSEKPIDLVLTDISMPEMDGITLIFEIRKLAIWIPIIVNSHCRYDESSGEIDLTSLSIKKTYGKSVKIGQLIEGYVRGALKEEIVVPAIRKALELDK